jgi:hypothetical protein
LWAEIGEAPQRLYNSAYRQAAILHDEDASRMLPLYAEAIESSKVLGWYPVGTTTLSFTAISDDWAKVTLYQAEGYLPLFSLRLVRLEDDMERILRASVRAESESPDAAPSPDAPQPEAAELEWFIEVAPEQPTYKWFYTAPSPDAPRIDEKAFGDQRYYDVVQRYGTWYVLANADGETCYVPVGSISSSKSVHLDVSSQLYVVNVKGAGLRAHLYAAPDKGSECLGVYYNGTQVAVLMDNDVGVFRTINGFYPVQVAGQKGYMEKSALDSVGEIWFPSE